MISVTYNTCSSHTVICFGLIDLYSVVDSSSPVRLWSSLIDVGGLDSRKKQLLRNMILLNTPPFLLLTKLSKKVQTLLCSSLQTKVV